VNESKTLWKKFCRDLDAAGQQVLSSDLQTNETERAEGLRYLTRRLRVGLDMHLEHGDPAFPSFYQASHATAKMGELDIRDVTVAKNGSFEIIVSREKSDSDWLPLAEDSSILIVRQTFFDRANEIPATVEIETMDGLEVPPVLDMNILSTALTRVPAFVNGTSAVFKNWAEAFRTENRNALNTVDQTMFIKAGGDPMIHYLHGWWELEDNQALRITSAIPDCEGWNFQINNIWMESLDYRYHNIHTNNGLANLNTDGSVTVRVSAKPQSGNWVDTAGHSKGTMLWRWTGAKEHPIPTVEIIDV